MCRPKSTKDLPNGRAVSFPQIAFFNFRHILTFVSYAFAN
jgi:hypothetical protein